MKINRNYILFSLLFSLLAYLLTNELLIGGFALVFSFLDCILLIRKENIKKSNESDANHFKEEFIYKYVMHMNDLEGDYLEETLLAFTNKFQFVDKENISLEVQNAVKNQIDAIYRKQKRKNKDQALVTLRNNSFDRYYDFLQKRKDEGKSKDNVLVSYLLSFLALVLIILCLKPFFISMRVNQLFFMAMIIFIAIYWIISHLVLLTLGEEKYE